MMRIRLRGLVAGCAFAALLTACTQGAAGATGGSVHDPVTLRLGYFPNLTHASALVGVERGLFTAALGPDVRLRTVTFNAGPAAVEALFSGAVDATYLGPNPTINAWVQSGGTAIRVISGAASGGAALVVQQDITSAGQLRGKTLATPQLGNTQDVALRHWLATQGLRTDVQGGGDVHIQPQDNAQIVQAFVSGQIDGAWVPEPYASRLVLEGHGHVLVDERSLWPRGRFVTTELVVRTDFLRAHPDVVRGLLRGQIAANDYINEHPAAARQAVNDMLARITGKRLANSILTAAWSRLTFTDDPITSSLLQDANDARDLGLLKPFDLKGLYALGPLNALLVVAGEKPVGAS